MAGSAFPFGEGGFSHNRLRLCEKTDEVDMAEWVYSHQPPRPFHTRHTVSTMMFPLVYTQMSLAISSALRAMSVAERSVLPIKARGAARA